MRAPAASLCRWSQTAPAPLTDYAGRAPPVHQYPVFTYDEQINQRFAIWQGDITTLEVDAITNTTDDTLTECNLVSERVMQGAGPDLKEEIVTRALECRTGEVVVTSGYNLRCRHIIHTVSPKYVAKYHTAAESSLHNCYKNVLHSAREIGARSLALCVISTPRRNFSPDVAAHVALLAVLILQLTYFLSFSLHILTQLQFAFVIYLLNATIRVLNDRLQYWNSTWDNEYNNSIISNRGHITFEHFGRIYTSIYKLITDINKQESVFIFILLCYKIQDMLNSLYFILSTIAVFTNDPTITTSSSFTHFTIEVIWFIYEGAALAFLIEPCNQTDKEIQTLKLRASHLICATDMHYNREKLFTFCQQLIFDVPVFSPLGICALRRDGLVTVISMLFTFLAIITQLQDGFSY